jgi:hypothetical protein
MGLTIKQWSEVEDRDGLRLSWNVFPSSRMVSSPIPRIAVNILNLHRKLHDLWYRLAHCTLL